MAQYSSENNRIDYTTTNMEGTDGTGSFESKQGNEVFPH